jgi:hypothetical protein
MLRGRVTSEVLKKRPCLGGKFHNMFFLTRVSPWADVEMTCSQIEALSRSIEIIVAMVPTTMLGCYVSAQ